MDPLARFEDEEGEEHKIDEMDWDEVLAIYPELRVYFDAHPEVRKHCEILRNQVKNMSAHAAGMIISNLNLQDKIPVVRDSKRNLIVSTWSEGQSTHELSEVGLVKFDILGLANLTVISDCLKLIEQTKGHKITKADIPINDFNAIKFGSKADLVGIFQFESPATKPIVDSVGMESIFDISAVTSLLRPGPKDMGMHDTYAKRKNGAPYTIPECLKEVFAETYGVVVYQEQCCSYNSSVLTDLGYFKIGDIATGKVKVNYVLCVNNSGDIVKRKFGRCVKSGTRPVIKLTLDNGFNLTCTKDHRIMTKNRGWVEAQYLTSDDDILTTKDME
jgi:DNA polymerase-3 subunit alpha